MVALANMKLLKQSLFERKKLLNSRLGLNGDLVMVNYPEFTFLYQ